MKLRVLLLILLLLIVPMPLALFAGMFVDYSDVKNRRYLPYHPGYYYHYWSGDRSTGMGTTGAGTSGGKSFRGGGPAFGK